MRISKNVLIGTLLILFAMFYCRQVFFGIGYIDNLNFMLPEQTRGYASIIVLAIPSILYLFIGFCCFYKPDLFEQYSIFTDFRYALKKQPKEERMEFGLATSGLILLAISFPIFTNLLFQLVTIGFSDIRSIHEVDNQYLFKTFFSTTMIAILLGITGYCLIKYRVKLSGIIAHINK